MPTTRVITLGIQGTAGSGSFSAGGDLTGSSTSQTVAKVNGVPAPTIGTAWQTIGMNAGATALVYTTIGGDVTAAAGPGALVVAKINGTSVPASPTTGYVLTATGATSATWQAPTSTAPTGTGLYRSTSGVMDAAALAGTSGQYMVSVGTTPTWVTAAGDWTGAVSANTVVALTGAAGVLPVAATGALIKWATATVSPGLAQFDNTTNSATASSMFLIAQNATGTTSTGGTLVFGGGTGTSADGDVHCYNGVTINTQFATAAISMTPPLLQWGAATASPFLRHIPRGTDAATSALTVRAQDAWASSTGANQNGAALNLSSGAGVSSLHGVLNLQVGGTTELSLSSGALAWGAASNTPDYYQTQAAGVATGHAMTFQAQSGGATSGVGGALVLKGGAGTGGDINGVVAIRHPSTSDELVSFDTTGPDSVVRIIFGYQRVPRIIQTQSSVADAAGSAMLIQAQAGSSSGAANNGGDLTLKGGDKVGTGVAGSVAINECATFVKGAGGSGDVLVRMGTATNGIDSPIFGGLTTSATTANTTLETIPITQSVVTQLTCIVVARSGTDYATFTISRSFYNNAGTVTADDSADVVTSTGKTAGAGSSIALNYFISGTNVLVRATPWTASSTSWRVWPQVVRV